jgi:septum site-determining protein MinD
MKEDRMPIEHHLFNVGPHGNDASSSGHSDQGDGKSPASIPASGQPHEGETKHDTRVIAIVSGKGGVGKTTFAANLSIALTTLGQRVLVIDCNVTTPHLSYYLGVKNFSATLNNIFAGEIEPAFAAQDQNGVMFIPASEKFVDLKSVDMKDLDKIVKKLEDKGRFDFIILDAAAGLGREALGTVNASDEIIFLTTPTAPSIMDITRADEVARLMGHKKFGMVLNMVRGKDHEIPAEKAEDLFQMPVLGKIPYDEGILDSTAEGVPIIWMKPNSKSVKYFFEVARRVIDEDFSTPFVSPSERQEQMEEEERWIEPIISKADKEKYSGPWVSQKKDRPKSEHGRHEKRHSERIGVENLGEGGSHHASEGGGLLGAIRGLFGQRKEKAEHDRHGSPQNN